MAKAPIFDRNTHERQKNLLAAEERRLQGKEDAKGFGLIAMGIGGLVLFVVCVAGFFGSFIFR